jgi:cardiolipin synthase
MHSKNLIIDNEFVSTGSTNFDFRSFEHNFEANLLIYDKETTTRMKETFFEDIKDSVKLSLSAWQQRPKTQSLIESIVRLFAPIL